MSDLIRREDALKAIDPGYGDFHAGNYNAIRALPAAQPDAAAIREAALREALDGLLTSVEHADFEDGWCCCGDDMLHHQSPMDCGHTPVDMGEYHASLAIKKARAALKGESRE